MREHSPRQHLDSTESLPEEEGEADEDALLPSMADGEDGSEEVDVAEGEVTELTDQLAELQELLAQKVLLINELQGTPGFSFSLSLSLLTARSSIGSRIISFCLLAQKNQSQR